MRNIVVRIFWDNGIYHPWQANFVTKGGNETKVI